MSYYYYYYYYYYHYYSYSYEYDYDDDDDDDDDYDDDDDDEEEEEEEEEGEEEEDKDERFKRAMGIKGAKGSKGDVDEQDEERDSEGEEDINDNEDNTYRDRSSFLAQIDEILSHCLASNLQRALFSATLGPFVRELADGFLQDPIHVAIGQENAGGYVNIRVYRVCGYEGV